MPGVDQGLDFEVESDLLQERIRVLLPFVFGGRQFQISIAVPPWCSGVRLATAGGKSAPKSPDGFGEDGNCGD